MSEWKSGPGKGLALWDKGYTWGSVTNLAHFGKTGFEAELFTGKRGSIGLKVFPTEAAAKSYIERGTAAKRDAVKVHDRAALHRALDAVIDRCLG